MGCYTDKKRGSDFQISRDCAKMTNKSRNVALFSFLVIRSKYFNTYSNGTIQRHWTCLALFIIFLSFIFSFASVSTVGATDFGIGGLADSLSPLVYPPCFQAETKVTPVWMFVANGTLTAPGQGTLTLREDFGLSRGALFLDTMVRLQAGALSFRVHYEPRAFIVYLGVIDNPTVTGRADLEYSGVRLGGDLDLVRSKTSRVGLDLDYQCYAPMFTQTIRPQAAISVVGENPLTLGAHAVYNPIRNLWGISGIFEIRGRWTISGASVTDMDASLGLKSPETVLGSVALKSGYRRTAIEFNDSHNNFETVLSGWFGELAYYY